MGEGGDSRPPATALRAVAASAPQWPPRAARARSLGPPWPPPRPELKARHGLRARARGGTRGGAGTRDRRAGSRAAGDDGPGRRRSRSSRRDPPARLAMRSRRRAPPSRAPAALPCAQPSRAPTASPRPPPCPARATAPVVADWPEVRQQQLSGEEKETMAEAKER
ncbi:hypothetical protein PVAP13_3KG414581 [Panicum virgatum]|uniref:Uncharacterized protein n=1 Tax=Panicum virgatum TaxID=38727 RepID=A0A8T0UWV4_PANVG|nr:hypothetical protein PVAP13_3KG414581 [Panicum virgatum]